MAALASVHFPAVVDTRGSNIILKMQAISHSFDNSRGDLSDFLDIYQTFVRLLGNLLKLDNSPGYYFDFSDIYQTFVRFLGHLLKFNNSRGDYSDFLDIYQTCVRFLGNLPKM